MRPCGKPQWITRQESMLTMVAAWSAQHHINSHLLFDDETMSIYFDHQRDCSVWIMCWPGWVTQYRTAASATAEPLWLEWSMVDVH